MAAKKTETLCVGCDEIWEPKPWEDYTGVCDSCLSDGKRLRFFKRQIKALKYSKPKPETQVAKVEAVSSPKVESDMKTPTRDPLYQYIKVEKSD